MNAYMWIATAAYAVLLAAAVGCLLLRTHTTPILRTFALLAVVCAALRILGTVVWQALPDASVEEWWYLAFTFLVLLAPTVFLAQLALIVRTWGAAYYSVFDQSRLALVRRLFGVVLAFSVLWQFLYGVVAPLACCAGGPGAVTATLVHHNVEAAENLLVALLFVAFHRRLTARLYPMERASSTSSASSEPLVRAYTDTASVRAERESRRVKLGRVTVTCVACLGAHAVTLVGVSYLNIQVWCDVT